MLPNILPSLGWCFQDVGLLPLFNLLSTKERLLTPFFGTCQYEGVEYAADENGTMLEQRRAEEYWAYGLERRRSRRS